MLRTSIELRRLVFATIIMIVIIPVATAIGREVSIPERGGPVSYGGYETWRHIQSSAEFGGAVVVRGGAKNTRRITRIVEHVIAAKRRGLSISIVNHIKVTYDLYSAGPNKGAIARVLKPTITRKEVKASLLGLIKLTVKLKNTVGASVGRSDGSQTFSTRHTISLTVPRQPFISRDSVTELIRQVLRFNLFDFAHTYRIVPGLPVGGIRVSIPL